MLTLSQADALSRVNGTFSRTNAPVTLHASVNSSRAAKRAFQTPDPMDDRAFRTAAALQRQNRYGK